MKVGMVKSRGGRTTLSGKEEEQVLVPLVLVFLATGSASCSCSFSLFAVCVFSLQFAKFEVENELIVNWVARLFFRYHFPDSQID